nr:cysteine-rich receptor-like protein kinase 25 [Quercus suber]
MTSFSLNPSITLLFISILSFLSLTTHATAPIHLNEVCANTTFSSNSIYQSNLNSLLSSLSSSATHNLEFYNTTSGQNTSNPVYGLFLCRGDVTPQLCQECVAAAVKEITKNCSREKVAVIWYDECMLRYSNRSFFSTVDEKPKFALLNKQNITEQERTNKLLAKSMNETAAQASNAPIGSKKFGTKQVNISAFQTLYNLVQCTADLSRNDCSTCLQAAINLLSWCCSGKQGGRVIFPSCNVRYELYPFYRMENATFMPTSAHTSSHPDLATFGIDLARFVSNPVESFSSSLRSDKDLLPSAHKPFLHQFRPNQPDRLSELARLDPKWLLVDFGFSLLQLEAWIHWRDGRPLELLDPTLEGFYLIDEAIKCIHIGLLCVQKDPADRPTMASIVLALNSHSVSLPAPQQPAFFLRNTDQNLLQMSMESDQSTSMSMSWSVNEESVTEPHAQ